MLQLENILIYNVLKIEPQLKNKIAHYFYLNCMYIFLAECSGPRNTSLIPFASDAPSKALKTLFEHTSRLTV